MNNFEFFFSLVFFICIASIIWIFHSVERATLLHNITRYSLQTIPKEVITDFCHINNSNKSSLRLISCSMEISVRHQGNLVPICSILPSVNRFKLRYYLVESNCQLNKVSKTFVFFRKSETLFSDFY